MALVVADSYREVQGAPPFMPWLEKAYAKAFSEPLEAALARQKEPLAAARWAFTLVKRLLPHFSLEEGYEFAYAALKGERQCLLQSVLVQGLLEQAGFRAGVYMVWRNPEGKESNLGHAVAVLRLEGRNYLVDPSEPEPFARHLGLFVDTGAGFSSTWASLPPATGGGAWRKAPGGGPGTPPPGSCRQGAPAPGAGGGQRGGPWPPPW